MAENNAASIFWRPTSFREGAVRHGQKKAPGRRYRCRGTIGERKSGGGTPGENIIPATDETVPVSEDAGGAATENSVLPIAGDIQLEPDNVFSVVSGVAEREDGSPLNPDSAFVEAALTDDFEVLEEIGDESLRVLESLARPYSENFRMFAREAADYQRTVSK